MYDSLLVCWSKHDVLANAIDVDTHGQLFVATDVERSDCVHLLLGALQWLDHDAQIPSMNHNCVQLFSFAHTLNRIQHAKLIHRQE